MDREPVAIPEDATVERALDEFFLRYRYPWFPVIDGSSRFVGLLDQGTVDRVDSAERATKTVGEILARDEGALTVRDDAPLESVLGNDGAPAPGRPDGDRRRRPAQRRDHGRRRRAGAARARDRATRGLIRLQSSEFEPGARPGPLYRIGLCLTTTSW